MVYSSSKRICHPIQKVLCFLQRCSYLRKIYYSFLEHSIRNMDVLLNPCCDLELCFQKNHIFIIRTWFYIRQPDIVNAPPFSPLIDLLWNSHITLLVESIIRIYSFKLNLLKNCIYAVLLTEWRHSTDLSINSNMPGDKTKIRTF